MPFSDLLYQDETGLHTPDYDSVYQYQSDQAKVIYGDDIDLDSNTKDGQQVGVVSGAIFDTCQALQATYNSYSPLTAIGKALSTQVKLNGLRRRLATNSSVDVDLVGQAGTTIINGIVADDLSQKWNLPASVTIPVSGTITVTATAQQTGNISAAANTITTIFTPVRGWQSVNNPAEAVEGVAVETDAELRLRQTQSTSLRALTPFEATEAAVAQINGVVKFRGYENDSDFTDANGIPPHTISFVVEGGTDLDVATAIWSKKTIGTGTYGTTSVVITDQYGVPSDIKFYRPTVVTIGVLIDIVPLTGFVSETVQAIQTAVADYINGLAIGETVYISRLYTPANLNGQPASETYDISSLQIQKDGGGFGAANIPLLFTELAECTADVDVIVNLV